jgi:hypothetical protein
MYTQLPTATAREGTLGPSCASGVNLATAMGGPSSLWSEALLVPRHICARWSSVCWKGAAASVMVLLDEQQRLVQPLSCCMKWYTICNICC